MCEEGVGGLGLQNETQSTQSLVATLRSSVSGESWKACKQGGADPVLPFAQIPWVAVCRMTWKKASRERLWLWQSWL